METEDNTYWTRIFIKRFCCLGRGPLLYLCFLLPASGLPLAFAQGLETKLELKFGSAVAVNAAVAPSVLWSLTAHLEARYALEPLHFSLVLDPGVQFGSPTIRDAGLTEVFVLLRQDALDFSAGVERLPLETARLGLPYSLEPVSPLGNRQGLPGVRVSWNPEATRLRLAVLADSGQVVPVLSLRREFSGFELEAHSLYRDGLILGLGGSGTLGETVVYGEVWWLAPSRWRGVLGLSGNLGDGTWTLEGGYAAPSAVEPVRPLLAGQLTFPQNETTTWTFVSKLFFGPDGFRTQTGLEYSLNLEQTALDATLTARTGPEPFSLQLAVVVHSFPDLNATPP